MCNMGYSNIEVSPTLTATDEALRSVAMLALQKAMRFGRAVGLAYQSPPPPYFSTATCWALRVQVANNKTPTRDLLIKSDNLGKATD